MNKKEILSLLEHAGLAPNKVYGQHFLIMEKYIEAIVTAISPQPNDIILEIGPGPGILTEPISSLVKKLICVEIDAGFVRVLKERFTDMHITIVHDDFLKLPAIGECTKVVGNLPYNVASQIIFKVAKYYTVPHCFFLIQKEMAERLIAKPKSKNYSAFTVGVQLYFKVQRLFDVPPNAFYPPPKVHSTFVQLTRKKELPLTQSQITLFEQLVESAFWARRKMLKTALKRSPYITFDELYIAQAFEVLGFDTKVRGEELSLDDFIALTKYCHHHQHLKDQ
ncbi:MAG: 16S rRNA (adenine(1518)-N(6)/adenine(1519)-N(6))-dimethyltransferase RsmA [Spirochaetes bacterium]|nr:16S rRNA (adenine(1518)-N(6)/adenine(1519)-N(6))-dimethyltransferase RsmA [Spirochaetota bacterium]